MVTKNGHESSWESRRIYLMVVLCQIMGLSMFASLANTAVTTGPTGSIMAYIACCLFGGIPLLYMEFIISQFTARDCIDVWKARKCCSHIGYILVFWQLLQIFYNHVLNAFLFHYLLISFENPIPYYICGRWAKNNCDILASNFTVNDDCIRLQDPPPYCDSLYTTFPEYQYWRYNIMGITSTVKYHIPWRVCLASALICVIMYFSIVKKKCSVAWVVQFFTMFPIIGYVILLMGSMVQKGVVVKYDEALDSDFSVFISKFKFTHMVLTMVNTLGIGTGVPFNLACSSSFREPAYSNTVITVVVVIGTSTLAVCITAMMSCPYSYEYAIDPYDIARVPISFLYEKTPRLLHEYRYKYFYLVLLYGCHSALGIGSNVILILHLIDMAVARNAMVAKYPGLTSFLGILCIFFISIPFMCNTGMSLLVSFKQNSSMFAVFVAVIEIMVFVVWYGVDKFSEDVHFMQGLQPKNYMKISWLFSVILLSYTYCAEMYDIQSYQTDQTIELTTWYIGLGSAALILFIFLIRLLVAACKNEWRDILLLDSTWGPKSELLQRSRAMFTAQAMTKEYLYRQYHLQAGIVARQRVSNCRAVQREV